MKLKYLKHKGYRVESYGFHSIQQILNPISVGDVVIDDKLYWYNHSTNSWVSISDLNSKDCYSSFVPCNSVKSFKRKLKQWSSYLPKGTKFVLLSKYIGYDVIGETN